MLDHEPVPTTADFPKVLRLSARRRKSLESGRSLSRRNEAFKGNVAIALATHVVAGNTSPTRALGGGAWHPRSAKSSGGSGM